MTILPLYQIGIVSSVCKKLKMPHFTAYWQPIDVDNFNSTDSYTRNFFPHPKSYSEALMEIVRSFRWKNFAFIYDNDDNLVKLQDTFSMNSGPDMVNKPFIKYYKLPIDSDDYKPLIKDISKSGVNQVMIDCTLKNTYSVLAQSVDVNMMSEYVVCV